MKSASFLESLWYANLDPDAHGTLPPLYLGVATDDLGLGRERCCEVWISACRGMIFHIHQNRTEKFATYSGGNPISSKRAPGKAYFFNKASNPAWVALGLRSFRRYFRRQTRVLANVELASDEQYELVGRRPLEGDAGFIERVISVYGESLSVPVGFAIDTLADSRFLAKFALGIGYKAGGRRYLESRYARTLRSHLNHPNPTQRPAIAAPAMLESSEVLGARHQILSWRGGIQMTFVRTGEFAGVHISVWGRHASIVISDDLELAGADWDKVFPRYGAVYVIVPQKDYFSPAIALPSYLNHIQGHRPFPELARAEVGRLGSLEDLPQKNPTPDCC